MCWSRRSNLNLQPRARPRWVRSGQDRARRRPAPDDKPELLALLPPLRGGCSVTGLGPCNDVNFSVAATSDGPVTLAQCIINDASLRTVVYRSGVTESGTGGWKVPLAAAFAVGTVPLSGKVFLLNDG